MRVAELLSIPYIRSAETVYDEASHEWVRRFEYEELPGCAIESLATLEGLRALELTRVGVILRHLAEGWPVPCPRAPLRSVDVAAQLRDVGLHVPYEVLDLPEERAGQDPAVRNLADAALNRVIPLRSAPLWPTTGS